MNLLAGPGGPLREPRSRALEGRKSARPCDCADGAPATPAQFTRNPFGGFALRGVHRYATAGTYTVTMTIHDSGGASASATPNLVVPASIGD